MTSKKGELNRIGEHGLNSAINLASQAERIKEGCFQLANTKGIVPKLSDDAPECDPILIEDDIKMHIKWCREYLTEVEVSVIKWRSWWRKSNGR